MKQTVWFILLANLFIGSQAAVLNKEKQLISFLLENSTADARPVLKQSLPTNVSFGVELVQLINVNDRYQMITTKLWVRMKWKNQLFTWNSTQWDNIKSVQVDAKLVWTPDIVLYNNAESSFSGGTSKYKTKILMYADGTHYWLSPGTFTSTCKIDITYFPFDQQTCILKYGSWAYDASGIIMLPDSNAVVTSQYINSSEWQIANAYKKQNSLKYACCKYPYIDVTVSLILKRKPLYYIFNVITPCIVLAITILFGFFLPPESGERISLTITILLAVAVFLQLVSDNLPRNSDSIPILAVFYMVIMAESALSLITTCVVLVCHFRAQARGVERPPEWIRTLFFKKITKFIKVSRIKHLNAKVAESMGSQKLRKDVPTFCNEGFAESYTIPLERETLGIRNSPKVKHGRSGLSNGAGISNKKPSTIHVKELDFIDHQNKASTNVLDDIRDEVQIIADQYRQLHTIEEKQDEWKLLATILDRLFFWVFVITLGASTLATLLPVYLKYNS
eukprot:gene9133-10106_t